VAPVASGRRQQKRDNMNPFQHSAVAALIYEVLDEANLRDGQEVLGELACRLAEVLAKTHRVKLGKAPDNIADYLDDPHLSNKGFVVAWMKALARANKKRSRRSRQRHP
jgi:hypothetical protein